MNRKNRQKIKNINILISLLLFSISLSSCVIQVGSKLKPVNNLKQVKNNQIILVGKVVITPPLKIGKEVSVGSEKNIVGKGFTFITDNKFVDVKGKTFMNSITSMSDLDNQIEGELGKSFYFAIPNQTLYMRVGAFTSPVELGDEEKKDIKETDCECEQLTIPGGFKVEIKPGDKAVYMGTLIYTRNEFMDIIKMTVIDEYKKEVLAYQKLFGNQYPLKKRILQDARTKR